MGRAADSALINNILTLRTSTIFRFAQISAVICLISYLGSSELSAQASEPPGGKSGRPAKNAGPGGQRLEADGLRDLDYQFKLKRPGADWVILNESRVRRINGDSVAGLYAPSGGNFSVVIVERAPGVELEAYARFYPGTLNVRNRKVAEIRKLETANGTAYRVRVTGNISGRAIAYFITIFKRDDVIYLLISWRDASRRLSPDLVRVHDEFRLLRSGPVKFRTAARAPAREHSGIGWRIRGNVYENAVHGVRCRLPGGTWRFMTAEELKRLNMDASMGMQHSSGVYVALIGEVMGGVEQKDYEKLIRGNFERGNRFGTHRLRPVRAMGGEFQGHLYEKVRSARMEFDYHMLVLKRGHVGLQIITWWHSGNRRAAMARLAEVHAGFEPLSSEQQLSLRGSLLRHAGRIRSVARHESFRNFTYRNFELGLSMRIPRGYWLHHIGPEARRREREVTLSLENLERGLYLNMSHEPREKDVSDADFHAAVLKNLEPYRDAKTEILNSGGLVIHSTRFHSGKAPQVYTYRLLTAGAGGKRLKILLYGSEGSMRQTLGLENEIIKGIRLTGVSTGDVVKRKDGSLEDHRLGFKVKRPDFTWSVRDILAGERKNRASMFFLRNPFSDADAVIGAMYVTADVRRLILQRLLNMPGLSRLKLKRKTESRLMWRGHPAILTVLEGMKDGQAQRVRFLTAHIGGILYLSLLRSKIGDDSGRVMADSFHLME